MSRISNTTAMVELLVGAAAACTVEEFAARAVEHDVPASTVTSLHAIHDDPQVVHNDVFVERDHPQAGRLREPRAAARLSATPQRVSDHAPAFGQHSDEIARELGLDPAALRELSVIF
jgi:crotonobetainyl-CoA:carnitine CoA-transferase CaiB-like acyl-CoA transferase